MVTITDVLCATCVVISTLKLYSVEADVFSAVVDMEPLLDIHKSALDKLEAYIARATWKLDILDKHLENYKSEHSKARANTTHYLGNPVNAFTLIKRLSSDLDHVEQIMNEKSEYIKDENLMYPTYEDVEGAALALVRLQDIYRLNVTQLAQGILKGTYSHGNYKYLEKFTPMTESDCYELGRVLYGTQNYQKAIDWMIEALYIYSSREERIYPFRLVDIVEALTFSYLGANDTTNGMQWMKNLQYLKYDDPDFKGLELIELYRKGLEEQKKEMQNKTSAQVLAESALTKTYEALCRGEMELPAALVKRLKCRYIAGNHPFLILAPIKAEELYLNPKVLMLHEVMSEDEIKQIKELAKLKLSVATVYEKETARVSVSHRISKKSWLNDDQLEAVARVSQRTADITGLSIESAESLQVANYGIGGHFVPHYDYLQDNLNNSEHGDRLATVLFYMSDVEQGGATIFTKLGLTVFPVKGAAIFWYNLQPSGVGDIATHHAACPVLRGIKWVANKWLHEVGQELQKPCTQDDLGAYTLRLIPPAIPKILMTPRL